MSSSTTTGSRRRSSPFCAEWTDRAAVAGLLEHLPANLDGVVNNAGIIVQGPVQGVSINDLARQLDVNVTAVLELTAPPLLIVWQRRIYSRRRTSGISPRTRLRSRNPSTVR